MQIIVFILGLFIGSFLNVCIYRIPAGKSIVYPPSSCGSCGHKLSFLDMIPVLNYIINKGRCRYCKEKYSLQYPIIELLNAVMYLVIFAIYGLSYYTAFIFILVSMLIVITLIDYTSMIIPNGIIIFGFIVSIIFKIVLRDKLVDSLIGLAIGFVLFLLIALITNAMGGGDIKLMSLLGFIFGVKGIVFISFFSFVLGALISVILMILKIKSKKDMIPFGPFISFAALLYIIYGNELINVYLNIFI